MKPIRFRCRATDARPICCGHISGSCFTIEDGFGYWLVQHEPERLAFHFLMGKRAKENYSLWDSLSCGGVSPPRSNEPPLATLFDGFNFIWQALVVVTEEHVGLKYLH